MPNQIVVHLKEAHKAVSRILSTLAGIPKAKKDLIDAGNSLSQLLVEAVASHIKGDLKGTLEESDIQLNRWMCSILRLSRDKDNSLDPLQNILENMDLDFIDRLAESRPKPKPKKISFTPVPDSLTVLSEDKKIGCRAEGCDGKYSTKKAYTRHLTIKHPTDAKRLRLPNGEEHRPAKQRIKCLLCGDQSVDMTRYAEHYKAKHDRQFEAKGRRVRF